MKKELITKAFEQAEKEAQEKEIGKIKSIVQSYLEEIRSKQENYNALGDEIKLLRKDLDDLKSGRLDKIEERQRVDEKAKEISLVIIKKIEKEYIPYYPWRSPWMIECKNDRAPLMNVRSTTVIGNNNSVDWYLSSGSGLVSLRATGQTFSNFSGGSYSVGDKIVNL